MKVLFGLVITGAAVLFIVLFEFLPWPIEVLVVGFFAWRGLLIAGQGVRSALASMRGEPEVTVSKRRLPVGGSLQVHYRQKFRRSTEVNRIVVELVFGR